MYVTAVTLNEKIRDRYLNCGFEFHFLFHFRSQNHLCLNRTYISTNNFSSLLSKSTGSNMWMYIKNMYFIVKEFLFIHPFIIFLYSRDEKKNFFIFIFLIFISISAHLLFFFFIRDITRL